MNFLSSSTPEFAAKRAMYLQRLMAPTVFPKIRKAVETKDRRSFFAFCREVKIPVKYVNNLVSLIFSTEPDQPLPWPPW